MTNSDVQDSATVIGEDTPSILTVTNNYNDSHGSAQIQDMLADVISILNNIQSQNAKANEGLDAKLMAENHKLADRLTEQLQHEITEVTEVICQLREETRHEIQSIKDDLNKLSTSVDETVSRNINPLKPELNPICYLLALLGAHHFLHVSRIRVKLLTFGRLMSYIYIYIYIYI